MPGALIGSFLVLFIGADLLGAKREIDFGAFHLQPSEFLKPSFAILAAAVLADRKPLSIPKPLVTFLLLLPALLILLKQPDVGQTGLLLCLWGGMLFFYGMSFVWVGVDGGRHRRAGASWRYEIFPHVHHRVDQYLGHSETGYQAGLALKAFANGGFAGVGPGAGTVKYRIPDVHSDFIFAVAGEEFGFLLCGLIALTLLRADGAAAAAFGGGARGLRAAGGRGSCGGDRRAGLHQYGRGGVAAAGQGHDPAVHFLWRFLAVRGGADHGLRAGGDAAAAQGPDPRRSLFLHGARMSGTIVLSAGGTGGHLFPAQALANELVKRGRKIVVMTDARFANYATQFPGATIQTVPSSPFNAITAPFKIAAGIVVALAKLMKLKPAAVIGFGGYPSVPVMLAATSLRLPPPSSNRTPWSAAPTGW